MPTTLIEQHQAYLHLQHRISKAIYNQDERLLMHLKLASHELFIQIEDHRKGMVEAFNVQGSRRPSSQADLLELVQVMEEAQQQVRENEKALQLWLDQMKSDVRHHRKSQSPRGVLATYMQQRQESPSQTANLDKFFPPSESGDIDPIPPTSSNPWMISGKTSDTMGHQINHQS